MEGGECTCGLGLVNIDVQMSIKGAVYGTERMLERTMS